MLKGWRAGWVGGGFKGGEYKNAVTHASPALAVIAQVKQGGGVIVSDTTTRLAHILMLVARHVKGASGTEIKGVQPLSRVLYSRKV